MNVLASPSITTAQPITVVNTGLTTTALTPAGVTPPLPRPRERLQRNLAGSLLQLAADAGEPNRAAYRDMAWPAFRARCERAAF